MRKLLRYLKDYKKECIVGPLFKLLEVVFELLVPTVMYHIIHTGIPEKDYMYVVRMGVLLLVLGIVGLASALTAQYFAANAATGMASAIRHDLYQHINRLSYTEIDKIGTSTLISRMINDVNQVQTAVNLVIRLMLRSPFVVVGAVIMAFTVDSELAVIFVLVVPLLSAIVFGIMLKMLPQMRRIQKQFDKILLHTRENLTGSRVIRAFNRQQVERDQFLGKSDTLFNLQSKSAKLSSLMNPATFAVINLAVVLLLFWGGNKINNGKIDQAKLVTILSYMSLILVELVKLANLIITLTKSFASGDRIQEIFDTSSSMQDDNQYPVSPAANAPKIEFRDVSMKYQDAAEPSLEHISFVISKGETVGIIGSTGCGKTTLVNLIPRFYDTTDGMIMVDGRDVQGYPLKQLRNKVGLVPQKAVLFKGTVRENLLWGYPGASDRDLKAALETAQALEIIEKKQEGLDFMLEQGGKNLSGGQRQRLTIARALVRKPEILILDDSSSALDYATEAKLRQALRENTKNMTVLIVSQRAASIMHADKIIVLDDGKVVGMGTHQELLQTCETYREICSSQLTEEE